MIQSEKNGFHEREMKCYRSSEDGEREIPACEIQEVSLEKIAFGYAYPRLIQ